MHIFILLKRVFAQTPVVVHGTSAVARMKTGISLETKDYIP